VQLAFLDLAKFVAMRILKFQGLAHAQRFAIHFEGFLTLRVLDPEIVADRNQFLAHLVAVYPAPAAWSSFFSSFLSFVSSHKYLPSSDYLFADMSACLKDLSLRAPKARGNPPVG
jgi:hypothetical protein